MSYDWEAWEEKREEDERSLNLKNIDSWFLCAGRIHWAEMDTYKERGNVPSFKKYLNLIRKMLVYECWRGRQPPRYVWMLLKMKMYDQFFAYFNIPVSRNGSIDLEKLKLFETIMT